MNDIVEYENEGEVVNVGDDTNANQISFQLAQSFYNEITGRSENKKDYSRESFILKLENITQLKYRLDQYLEQFNVCSKFDTYSVKYVDDSSERYSSLERLKLHSASTGKAIEELNIQYNLLIILPKTNRPQEYKISIKLVSRIAQIERMRDEIESSGMQFPLHNFEKIKTAVFSIDFVDVSVADGMMSVLKGWFNSIERKDISLIRKFVQKKSHFLPIILKYSFLLIVSYYVYIFSDPVSLGYTKDLRSTSLFILGSFLVGFFCFRLGSYLGRITERNIDNVYEPSYINFSGADETFFNNSSVKIKSSRNAALYSLVVAIAIKLIAGFCAYILS